MKTALVAAALTLATAFAGAAPSPTSFANHEHVDATGFGAAFSDAFNFSLDADSWVSGSLFTNTLINEQPSIDVQSVVLSRVGANLSWTESQPIDWDMAAVGVEQWLFNTQLLAAGDWQLVVSGVSYADKGGHGYDANLVIPEPASLPLVGLALMGALAIGSRRRA